MTMLGSGIIPTFTLSDRLRKARELTGLDQGEFAARAGISRGSVSNYEAGIRVPRIVYLRAWADAAGVDRTWLETGTAPSEDGADSDSVSTRVRPEGFEPPTFCSVVEDLGADDVRALWAAQDAVSKVVL